MVNLKAVPEDARLIQQIVDRAGNTSHLVAALNEVDKQWKLTLSMDLSATHVNGCPLRLFDLLNARTSDFVHDILGITRHMDRKTGKLDGNFRPRHAR